MHIHVFYQSSQSWKFIKQKKMHILYVWNFSVGVWVFIAVWVLDYGHKSGFWTFIKNVKISCLNELHGNISDAITVPIDFGGGRSIGLTAKKCSSRRLCGHTFLHINSDIVLRVNDLINSVFTFRFRAK